MFKASHASETCTILWVLNGNKEELFLALCQEDISLTRTSQNTIGNQKLFNGESLVVEEDFLILWPTLLENHLVKADVYRDL